MHLCSHTGIALLYLHLHSIFRDSSLLQKALEHISHALKCLTRRHDVTFLCGDAGPLAVAAVVYYRLQRMQEADECLGRSERCIQSSITAFNFLLNGPDTG